MWLGLFRLYPCWAVPFFVTSRLPHLLGSRFLLKLVKMGSVWIYEPLRYNISIWYIFLLLIWKAFDNTIACLLRVCCFVSWLNRVHQVCFCFVTSSFSRFYN
uniref:Uncharacterized protein n=2 Tax=Rhizophora mucronata TaxID=61149 RepID=A0A2P2JV52_RHIMU